MKKTVEMLVLILVSSIVLSIIITNGAADIEHGISYYKNAVYILCTVISCFIVLIAYRNEDVKHNNKLLEQYRDKLAATNELLDKNVENIRLKDEKITLMDEYASIMIEKCQLYEKRMNDVKSNIDAIEQKHKKIHELNREEKKLLMAIIDSTPETRKEAELAYEVYIKQATDEIDKMIASVN